jgi:dolichyl-phosphate-mannose-protein mannosyltransferase
VYNTPNMTTNPRETRYTHGGWFILTAAFFVLGALLRFYLLARMAVMLNFDEAYDAVDALSLIHSPRLVAFFPANYGRESGFMYYLAAWIKLPGAQPFILRVAVVLIGVLTLAAVYRLARELVNRRVAMWSVGALGVLYWHVHLSHIVLRAILFPLTAALALAFLLAAHRANRMRLWLAGGLCLGLTVYTYFSSLVWIAFAVIVLGWWLVREPARRRGVLSAAGLSALIAVPMAIYLLGSFNEAAFRPASVAVLTPDGLAQNALAWINAWVGKGSEALLLNFPARPILDLPLALLALAGIAALILRRANLRAVVWILSLAGLSILPSLISDFPPHPLRAIGLVVPLAILLGLGASLLSPERRGRAELAALVPIALIGWAGFNTAQAFSQYLERPDVSIALDEPMNSAAAWIASHSDVNKPVYFSPLAPDHPGVGFNEARLSPRPVSAFNATECQVLSESGAIYSSLSMYDPDFAARISPFADVHPLFAEPADPPRYDVYGAAPRPPLLDRSDEVQFGDLIAMQPAADLPDRAAPGDTLHVVLAFRPLTHLDQVYSVFIHLYGDPTPYEGGAVYGQADSWICPSHLSIYWTPREILIQSFDVVVDPAVPAGDLTLAVGIYAGEGGERLPITNADAPPERYYPLYTIKVEP